MSAPTVSKKYTQYNKTPSPPHVRLGGNRRPSCWARSVGTTCSRVLAAATGAVILKGALGWPSSSSPTARSIVKISATASLGEAADL